MWSETVHEMADACEQTSLSDISVVQLRGSFGDDLNAHRMMQAHEKLAVALNAECYITDVPAVFSTLEERYLPAHRSAVAQLLARSQECRVLVFSPGTCTQTSRLFRSQLLSVAEKELLAQRAVGDAELILHEDGRLCVRSRYRYIQGFGHHYVAVPEVTVTPDSSVFDISLSVTNLSSYQPMPLQYMCHMNHAFVPGGVMSDNLGEGALQLRCTVPAHVIPTPNGKRLTARFWRGSTTRPHSRVLKRSTPKLSTSRTVCPPRQSSPSLSSRVRTAQPSHYPAPRVPKDFWQPRKLAL